MRRRAVLGHLLFGGLSAWLAGRPTPLSAQPPVMLGPPIKTPAPPTSLTVDATGPDSASVGDVVLLRIQIHNGVEPLTVGRVRVELSEGLKHVQGRVIAASLPPLPAGSSREFTLSAQATQAGRQVAVVKVQGDREEEKSTQVELLVTPPALELRFGGPAQRFLGRLAEFDLEVFNQGSKSAANLRVSVEVPLGLEFASASDGGAYQAKTRQVHWLLGSLEPQQHRGLTLHLRTEGAGLWTAKAVARADGLSEASAEATLRGDAVPALLLEVADSDDPIAVGAETVYVIRAVNQGSCASINLQILATVPAGLTLIDMDGPTRGRVEGQEVMFAPLPKLAPRAEVVYRLRARGFRPGDWRLKVQMSSDQLRLPLTAEEETRVYQE